MFVVYTPEGRSFIGEPKKIPSLKVGPVTRVNPIEEDVLEGGGQDQTAVLGGKKSNLAVHAYQENQRVERGRMLVKASEIMSSPVEVISDESTLEEAWLKMQAKQVSYLPVVRDGRLIGLCTQVDLLGRMIVDKKGKLEGVKPEIVADVMHAQIVTTSGDTDIRHVAMALTENKLGALIIMNVLGDLIGIVTEGDLIKRLSNEPPVELYT